MIVPPLSDGRALRGLLSRGRERLRANLGDKVAGAVLALAFEALLLLVLLSLGQMRPEHKDVPMATVAFDARGHRLGYGGGYYDRTLEALRAHGNIRAIGIAYAGQEVESIPDENHDHLLDMVATEDGIRRFPAQ